VQVERDVLWDVDVHRTDGRGYVNAGVAGPLAAEVEVDAARQGLDGHPAHVRVAKADRLEPCRPHLEVEVLERDRVRGPETKLSLSAPGLEIQPLDLEAPQVGRHVAAAERQVDIEGDRPTQTHSRVFRSTILAVPHVDFDVVTSAAAHG